MELRTQKKYKGTGLEEESTRPKPDIIAMQGNNRLKEQTKEPLPPENFLSPRKDKTAQEGETANVTPQKNIGTASIEI